MKVEYFQTEEGLNQLLVDYKDVFDMIDDYGQQLIQGVLSTPIDYKTCLDKLTGAFVSLEPLYAMAVAYKKNEELKAYVDMKRETENEGKKVVAVNIEREASLSVATPRRVRNILEGYVEACAKGIGTCQTQLKRLELEYRNKDQNG